MPHKDPTPIPQKTLHAKVREIYKQADQIPAERFCENRTECCRFRLTGKTPLLTYPEAELAAQAWRATGRKQFPESTNGDCPMLSTEGKCLIYKDRPLGCRTHFCQPAGGPIPRRDLIPYIRELEAIPMPEEFKRGPLAIERAIPIALEWGKILKDEELRSRR